MSAGGRTGLAVAAAEQQDEPFQVLAQLADAIGGMTHEVVQGGAAGGIAGQPAGEELQDLSKFGRAAFPRERGHRISCGLGLLVCGDLLVVDGAVVAEGGVAPAVVVVMWVILRVIQTSRRSTGRFLAAATLAARLFRIRGE